MALLTNADRRAIWVELMDKGLILGCTQSSKHDVRTLINSLDAGVESVAATLNQSIPQPQRDMFTTAVKAIVLGKICEKRSRVAGGS